MLVMPEPEREATLAEIGAFLASRPETARGEFTLPMLTGVLRVRRRWIDPPFAVGDSRVWDAPGRCWRWSHSCSVWGVSIYVLLPHKLVFAFRGQALLAPSDHEALTMSPRGYRAAGIWIEPMLESNAIGSAIFRLVLHQLRASDGRSDPWTVSLGG
jgi:hypothetical protein